MNEMQKTRYSDDLVSSRALLETAKTAVPAVLRKRAAALGDQDPGIRAPQNYACEEPRGPAGWPSGKLSIVWARCGHEEPQAAIG